MSETLVPAPGKTKNRNFAQFLIPGQSGASKSRVPAEPLEWMLDNRDSANQYGEFHLWGDTWITPQPCYEDLDLRSRRLVDTHNLDLLNLKMCYRMNLSNNFIDVLEFSSILPKLTWLDVSCNQIYKLSDSIGNVLPNIEHLDLHNNRLTMMPQSMAKMKHLVWLNVEGNPKMHPSLKDICGSDHCVDEADFYQCATNLVSFLQLIERVHDGVVPPGVRSSLNQIDSSTSMDSLCAVEELKSAQRGKGPGKEGQLMVRLDEGNFPPTPKAPLDTRLGRELTVSSIVWSIVIRLPRLALYLLLLTAVGVLSVTAIFDSKYIYDFCTDTFGNEPLASFLSDWHAVFGYYMRFRKSEAESVFPLFRHPTAKTWWEYVLGLLGYN